MHAIRPWVHHSASSPTPVWEWLDVHNRALTRALLVVAAAVGAAYISFASSPVRTPDEAAYLELARSLAAGDGYQFWGSPTAIWPPGWPLTLAPFVVVGFTERSLHLVTLACFLLALWLLSAIARRLGGPNAGVITLALALAYPLLPYSAVTLYPQTLAAALVLAAVWLLLPRENVGGLRAGALGLVFGWLILTVPLLGVLLPVALAWMVRRDTRKTLGSALVVVCTVAMVVGLWTVRNYTVFGRFVPVATNGGFNLLFGNSPGAKASSGTEVDLSAYDSVAGALDEVERDRFFARAAVDHMVDHPVTTARLLLGKLVHHFAFTNELRAATNATRMTALMLLTYGPLLAALGLRLLLWRRLRPTPIESLLVAMYLSGALAYAVFFTRIRFRVPFDWLLVLLVGLLVARLGKTSTSESTRQVAVRPYAEKMPVA